MVIILSIDKSSIPQVEIADKERDILNAGRWPAIAMGLLGWYLLVTPFLGSTPENSKAKLDAPLREWSVWAGFDSAMDCNRTSEEYYEEYLKEKTLLGPQKMDEIATKAGFTGDERKIFAPWMETASRMDNASKAMTRGFTSQDRDRNEKQTLR